MGVKNPAARDIKKSQVYMENLSFDPAFEVLTRIPLTLNPVSGNLERTTAIQGNPSMTLTYDGSGNLTTLTKTIDGTTYTKVFTWAGGRITDISTWV
jgi:YD repeat-containing protein